jgi:bifunctional enzyme CysN/CysC
MEEDQVKVAFVGHVDHGKSSVLGRLLVDTQSLPDGKLEQVKKYCENNSRDFEYAYLIDSLEKEQSQGITIDAARYFIRQGSRKFLFIDTPGHLDFIKNMITGSSLADIGLLIVDAKQGIQQNTLRHIFLLSFLHIQHVIVLINKMDQVEYSEEIYSSISKSITAVFESNRLPLAAVVPISAKQGDNILSPSSHTPWYKGLALWPLLSKFSHPEKTGDKELRMPLQDVYRFSQRGDERRIYCGTIASGVLKQGDRLLFSPSQKEGIVAKIESVPSEPSAGFAVGFTLEHPIFVERGELISHVNGKTPLVSHRFKARLFWISLSPIIVGKKYTLRLHTNKVGCSVEKILAIYDSATLRTKGAEGAQPYDIVECLIETAKPVAFDIARCLESNRFILVDQYEVVSNGVILDEVQISKDLPVASSSGSLVVLVGKKLDLSPLHRKLAERNLLVYSINIEELERNREFYSGIFKVCRDLCAICLVQLEKVSENSKEFFSSQFDRIQYISIELGVGIDDLANRVAL